MRRPPHYHNKGYPQLDAEARGRRASEFSALWVKVMSVSHSFRQYRSQKLVLRCMQEWLNAQSPLHADFKNHHFAWALCFWLRTLQPSQGVALLLCDSNDILHMLKDVKCVTHFKHLRFFFSAIGRTADQNAPTPYVKTVVTGSELTVAPAVFDAYNPLFSRDCQDVREHLAKAIAGPAKIAPLSIMVYVAMWCLNTAVELLCKNSKAESGRTRVVSLLYSYLLIVLQVSRPNRSKENVDLTFHELALANGKWFLETLGSGLACGQPLIEGLLKGKQMQELVAFVHHPRPSGLAALDAHRALYFALSVIFALEPERISRNPGLHVFTVKHKDGTYRPMEPSTVQTKIRRACKAAFKETMGLTVESFGGYSARRLFCRELVHYKVLEKLIDPRENALLRKSFGHFSESAQVSWSF